MPQHVVWRMGGSAAETIRQPRDRLKGQPQERQHSAAAQAGRGTDCPRRGVQYFLREGSSPEGPRPGIPLFGICGAR